MYRLLDLYEESYDPNIPVVCFDEKSKQLLEEVRRPIPIKPGSCGKYDYEYRRNGTRNIFVAVEPKAGKRTIEVTKTRKKVDFAHFIRRLANQYRQIDQIRLVLDNLNTHFQSSFYETFPAEEAERLLNKIEFYYTPKHASWLNMAEIEINAMSGQCLQAKIGDQQNLIRQVTAWAQQRNNQNKKIYWTFTKQDAYEKLSKHYIA
jgi:DNA-binding transcriptional MerR regulator